MRSSKGVVVGLTDGICICAIVGNTYDNFIVTMLIKLHNNYFGMKLGCVVNNILGYTEVVEQGLSDHIFEGSLSSSVSDIFTHTLENQPDNKTLSYQYASASFAYML